MRRGSDFEKDLKNLYSKYKGNMKMFFSSILCSYPKLDSHRFKDVINEAIHEGQLKLPNAYQKCTKQIGEIKPPTDPLSKGKSKRKSS